MGFVLSSIHKGVIGIALANSPEFVAAAAGSTPVFGTNPVAFGIPRAGGPPLTFDMATSAIALFGVLTAKAKVSLLTSVTSDMHEFV